jgi:hypothetical protein
VNYEQDRDTTSGADGVPALLFVNPTIWVRYNIRILEDPGGGLKRNVMLTAVRAILLLVPHEYHMYIQKCITLRRRPDGRSCYNNQKREYHHIFPDIEGLTAGEALLGPSPG